MRRFSSHLIGVDQGSLVLFADFKDGGAMWTGEGPREMRRRVDFDGRFLEPPMVTIGLSMWDMGGATNQRADIGAEEVTTEGFTIVFRTWGDSRVARVRADWAAWGEVRDEDDWEVR